jgi:hypothetical protein
VGDRDLGVLARDPEGWTLCSTRRDTAQFYGAERPDAHSVTTSRFRDELSR